MGDLISRDALLKYTTRMTEYDESGCGVPVLVVRADDIEKVPGVDAEPVITGETSDGYHTFNELYHHRAVLFSVIVKACAEYSEGTLVICDPPYDESCPKYEEVEK